MNLEVARRDGCDELVRTARDYVDDARWDLQRFVRHWPDGMPHRSPHNPGRKATILYTIMIILTIAMLMLGIIGS